MTVESVGLKGGQESAQDAATPFVRAQGIVKRYGIVTALEDVAVSVSAGEVLAVAGENGSGKSTLVKVLAGVIRPDRGRVLVNGEQCSFQSPREALSAGVAMVGQDTTSVPEMSIGENVMLPFMRRSLRRFSKRQTLEAALPHMEAVGLSADPARPLLSLRAGDRELVEMAKALACEPRLLILDEITTRLPDAEHLFEVVERLKDGGVATIFITHRLREIERLADRVVVLRDGRNVGELASDEIDEDEIVRMMVSRELKTFFHHDPVSQGDVALRVDGLVVPGTNTPICFDVRAGEVVGVAGLMGAGRSELLETLAGVTPAVSGTIAVDGATVRCRSTRAALAAGIALVPEDRTRQGLVLDASLYTNVTMGHAGTLSLVRRREERSIAGEAVEALRIRAAGVEAPVRTLSGGNQQKVVIARALRRAPRVLLLDEPTRGVDVGAKEEIYRLISEMLGRGMAVLMASSDLLELLGLSDRVLVMCERRVVGELSREQATEEEIGRLSAGGGKRNGDG